jgi:hypothetical protein
VARFKDLSRRLDQEGHARAGVADRLNTVHDSLSASNDNITKNLARAFQNINNLKSRLDTLGIGTDTGLDPVSCERKRQRQAELNRAARI